MSCCLRLDQVTDWYDWEGAQPQEISDLVAYASFGGGIELILPGTRTRVADFANQSWAESQLTIASQPLCLANGSDKEGNNANAQQWMFDHRTWNDSATLPPALTKVMFMRAGTQWRMSIAFSRTGPEKIDEVYLAFRDNGGTRGDYAGTYPVIKWASSAGGYDGLLQLFVDLRRTGRYNVVLWTKSKPTGTPASPVYSMTEMEWIVN
jgi:hypothetical protein